MKLLKNESNYEITKGKKIQSHVMKQYIVTQEFWKEKAEKV